MPLQDWNAVIAVNLTVSRADAAEILACSCQRMAVFAVSLVLTFATRIAEKLAWSPYAARFLVLPSTTSDQINMIINTFVFIF